MIQMNLFTKQTHRYRKQIMITKGEREVKGKIRGVWDQQTQTITYKEDKHKVLQYITGNYIQYFIQNYNRKESEKEYRYKRIQVYN